VSTWDSLAPLPVVIEGYDLEGLEQKFSEEFTRVCTLVKLRGGGEEGVGEDVVYDALDHIAMQDAGPVLDLAGEHTLGSFAELLDATDLFPGSPPARGDVSRLYRRWAFDSAALDLALRQGGKSLGEVLGREPRPLNYVVSMRLTSPAEGEPETAERLNDVLARYPGTRFKLDPTNTWSDELIAELAATGAVDSLDLKGHYKGTPVDVATDPELYRKVAEAFPDAWLEDPDLDDPEAAKVLEPHRDRLTWDAPVHSIADIEALPFAPKTVNIKPSRMGALRDLCAAYDYCDAKGIGAYGGGQSELGVGRDHIQYLASIFHPDTPNDTAPREFNMPKVPEGLPSSPMDLPIADTGFRFSGGEQ
jgi:L-alanine-DL-glutamate epimerase-like enolase superfamily enzyme